MNLSSVLIHVRRNKIIYISIVVILIMSLGTILALGFASKQNSATKQDDKAVIHSMADSLKQQGVAAESTNDYKKALEYYQQAKAKYETTGDANSIVDMKAKIYLMEHK